MGEQVALHNDQLQLESGSLLLLSSLGHKCLLIVSYLGCAAAHCTAAAYQHMDQRHFSPSWVYGMCM